MIKLALCNHKGGSGKTTSSINLAAALGLSGYRTLVIDLDPQGFLSRMLGGSEPPESASSMVLFHPDGDLSKTPVRSVHGFDLLPSSTLLSKALRRLSKPTDVFWLKEALDDAIDYDVVLIDTAAAITVFSLNALVACQHVIIPVVPEYQPVLGAEQTYQTAMMVRDKLNPTLNLPHFLFTMVDGRKSNHHSYRRYMRRRYGDQVMETIIRTSTSLSVTHETGTTIFDFMPHARGARDYANAADEFLRALSPPPRPRPVTPALTPDLTDIDIDDNDAPDASASPEGGGPWQTLTLL